MKILFAILLLLLIVKSACTQVLWMDSLRKQIFLTSVPDTQRVLLMSSLAAGIAYSRPDSAMVYAQQAVNLARKIGFVRGEENAKFSMGEIMWLAGEYSSANELLLHALEYAKSINDSLWQMVIYWTLSTNNRDQGNYKEGLKYSYKANELAKSSFISELQRSYLETGSIYQEMNLPDSALHYLQQLNFPDNDAYYGYTGFKFLMIGLTYAKLGNDTLALKNYGLSIESLSKSNNTKDLATVYNSIAKLYKKEGKADSSIYYAKKGFDIAQKGTFRKGVFETSLFLSEIYEKKDAALSLKYFKIATAAKDSMFNLQKTTQSLNAQFNEQIRQQEDEAQRAQYRNKSRTYILLAALSFLLVLAIILYRNNRHKQRAKIEIEKAYEDLKVTQSQLIQSEKMASLGELTAGIAHEIQNPLNFVNNFSEVNTELIDELKNVLKEDNKEESISIANEIRENEEKINHHGKRADAIVKSMLQHSRGAVGKKELTDINALADEYLRLCYHGLRAKDKSLNAIMQTDFDKTVGKVSIIPQDMGRLLLNLYNNAFYAVTEKKKQRMEGFEPTVSVSTKKLNDKIEIKIKDNGAGVSEKVREKIFQPFFTTKPPGQGTGLGLFLAYDIITKEHGGQIKVETKEGEWTEFIIEFPIR